MVATLSVPDVGQIWVRRGESDLETFRQVFGHHQYDLSHPAALRDRVRARAGAIVASGSTPVIVDAGANVGAASLYFAREYPSARIVAIEPDEGNAVMLARNVAAVANCTVMRAAIGSQPGFVGVNSNTADALGWAKQTSRASSGVPILTVVDAVDVVPNGKLLMVKIDIEGFESDLFASNLGWLDEVELVYVEPHDWMMPGQRSSFAFQRAMAQHPFELFIKGENLIYARA